ncbi:MAG: flavin reductase family protein [Steroidobacteraceae bacterium]
MSVRIGLKITADSTKRADAGARAVSTISIRADSEVDTKAFRRALGRFGTGVTVLTTRGGTEVRGMTANAFMSGSLHPPLVIVSIDRNARLHHHVADTRLLGISILSASQEAYSRHFAGQVREDLRPEFEFICGIPVLANALATIATEVYASYPCGDHTLFVARVRHVAFREGSPLLYFTGAYGSLAPVLKEGKPCAGGWDLYQAPWW